MGVSDEQSTPVMLNPRDGPVRTEVGRGERRANLFHREFQKYLSPTAIPHTTCTYVLTRPLSYPGGIVTRHKTRGEMIRQTPATDLCARRLAEVSGGPRAPPSSCIVFLMREVPRYGIRKSAALGPYSRTMPRALRWF